MMTKKIKNMNNPALKLWGVLNISFTCYGKPQEWQKWLIGGM